MLTEAGVSTSLRNLTLHRIGCTSSWLQSLLSKVPNLRKLDVNRIQPSRSYEEVVMASEEEMKELFGDSDDFW